ncbi:hypothetical protein LXL04_003978 [Taraxacum kok-saghyz]
MPPELIKAPRLFSRSRFMLRSFENSYIPENPRTPPISYISQTVIPFKKPTSEPSKTGFETKQKTVHVCTQKKFAHMQTISIFNGTHANVDNNDVHVGEEKRDNDVPYKYKACVMSWYTIHIKSSVNNLVFRCQSKDDDLGEVTRNAGEMENSIENHNGLRNQRTNLERWNIKRSTAEKLGSRSQFFENNNDLGDIGNWGSSRNRITPKSLIFSKIDFGVAKKRSNTSPNLYNTYLKGFVKKKLKNNAKKVAYMKKKQKKFPSTDILPEDPFRTLYVWKHKDNNSEAATYPHNVVGYSGGYTHSPYQDPSNQLHKDHLCPQEQQC